MSTIDQSKLLNMRSAILQQNEALQRAAGTGEAQKASGMGAPQKATGEHFASTLTGAIQAVNGQQARAGEMTAAYERGETNDIVGVMMERHKASLAFETTLQVRNKLLSAYRDIMNMPV